MHSLLTPARQHKQLYDHPVLIYFLFRFVPRVEANIGTTQGFLGCHINSLELCHMSAGNTVTFRRHMKTSIFFNFAYFRGGGAGRGEARRGQGRGGMGGARGRETGSRMWMEEGQRGTGRVGEGGEGARGMERGRGEEGKRGRGGGGEGAEVRGGGEEKGRREGVEVGWRKLRELWSSNQFPPALFACHSNDVIQPSCM